MTVEPATAVVVRAHPPRRRAIVAALATFGVFLVVTALTWRSIVDVAHDDASARFEASADQAALAVSDELASYDERLHEIGVFATAGGGLSPEAFSTAVQDSGLFEQLPSVVGVVYLARVPVADLDAFVEQARIVDPDFTVAQIAEQEGDVAYLVMAYAPGRVDLQLPIGADISPIESVVDTAERSAETGNGVAGSFQQDPFLQRIAGRNDFPMVDELLDLDFFLGVPIYAPGTEVQGPPNEPVGWVAATIADFEEVAAGATAALPDDLGLALTVELDGTTDSTGALSEVAEVEGDAGPRSEAAFEASRTIEVDGVVWHLDLWSSPDAAVVPSSARVALAAGIAGSALAAALVYVRLRERDRERTYASETVEREQFQREILDSVTNPMVVLDADGGIVRTNPAWDELWARVTPVGAHPSDRWAGASYLEVLDGDALEGMAEVREAVAGVLDGATGTTEVDLALRAVPGEPTDILVLPSDRRDAPTIEHDPGTIWLAVRVTPLRDRPGAIVIHTDITERKRSHAELAVQATRDLLTGLANRATFEDEVERALAPDRLGHRIAVLFIDLDGFKPVNDTYGHAVGDEVLRTVARRIDAVIRSSDTAGRLGGDEFVVLIDPLGDVSVAAATADRILSALSTPIHTDTCDLTLGASIGVAVIDGRTYGSAAAVIDRADAAMYASKNQGGARTTVVGA